MSTVVNIYFNIDKNRNAAFIFYKSAENTYEMCKLCLYGTIKLSTCLPVELCNKCAPTPQKCIVMINNKKYELIDEQRSIMSMIPTDIIYMVISHRVPVKLRKVVKEILGGTKSIRFNTTYIIDTLKQTGYATKLDVLTSIFTGIEKVTFIPMKSILKKTKTDIEKSFENTMSFNCYKHMKSLLL